MQGFVFLLWELAFNAPYPLLAILVIGVFVVFSVKPVVLRLGRYTFERAISWLFDSPPKP